MADRQKVEINLIVNTPLMSPKKVAALIDRLIAVGIEEAHDSMEDEHDEDAEIVIDFSVGKAKAKYKAKVASNDRVPDYP